MEKLLLIASLIFSIQQPIDLQPDVSKILRELENQRIILQELSENESIERIKEIRRMIDIQDFITATAIEFSVDPQLALFIVRKESDFNPLAEGDLDKKCKNGTQMRSRGLFQINECAWPKISDEVAFDIVSSTLWAMPKIKKTPEIWSTYRFCKQWYTDCPL